MITPLARLLTSAVLAAMLAAPQLLPTLELSRLSTRQGGLPYREAVSFSLRPRLLVYTLFPAVGNDPAQVFASPAYSEFLATVGVIGLGLALLGIWQGQRNGRRRHLILVVAGFALALGVFNPLYYVLYRLVPGFSLFRAPARWMLLTMFGLALLSGTGLDALGRRAAQMRLPWRWLLGVLALWAFLAVLPGRNTLPAPLTVLEWLVAMGVLALAWRLRPLPRWAQASVLVLAVAELWLAASGLAYRAAMLPEVASALRTAPSHLLADPQRVLGQFRFISLSGTGWDPGDLDTIRANLGKRVSERALYDYVIGVKQQEILAPNLPLLWRIPAVDGYDGGLLPTARYVALERLLLDNHQEPPPDGRLREILTHIPAGRWLNLLNVKYVITDKLFDLWYEGVYYDLQHRASLSPGQPVTASEVPPLEATAVGVISYLEDASVADGTPVAEIRLTAADGRQQRIALRAGTDTAAGQLSASTSTRARAVHAWPQGGGQDYLGMLALDAPMQPVTITVTSLLNDGRVVVRGISLIDTRTQTHVPVMLSTEGRFARVHSGDVKVYQNLDVLPHVYLVGRARSVATDEAALQMLADPAFDPHREVLLQDTPLSGSAPTEPLQGTAQVVGYSPEKIDINVQTEQAAWLVLGESDYPGWQASIDGRTVPIRRANYLFQAIEVPAGTHQVTFTFGSKGLLAGLLVMALAAVLCAVLLGIRFSPYTNGCVYTPSCASCWC